MERLTTEELRTLCWAMQNQYATALKQNHYKKNATTERLCSISKKAYAELIERDNKETE